MVDVKSLPPAQVKMEAVPPFVDAPGPLYGADIS